MRIELFVEEATEKALVPTLRNFVNVRINGPKPSLSTAPCRGRLPQGASLKKLVERLLRSSDHVIALTDVYPDYESAEEAKRKMREWAGYPQQFHPHAAQFELEAWLLPFWERIQHISGHNQSSPGGNPEQVNHSNPPSKRIKEIFRRGNGRYDYVKPRDAARILRDQDLNVSIQQCPELKSLVNTILGIGGGQAIP